MRLVFLFFLINVCFSQGWAQITFIIDEMPGYTPGTDTIFITGTFNNWTTNASNYMLRKQLDGRYAITVEPKKGVIEYKFTRGSWLKVETDANNTYTVNRKLVYDGNATTILVKILNWQDLGGAKPINFYIFYLFSIGFQGLVFLILIFTLKKRDVLPTNLLALFTVLISALLFGRVLYDILNPIWQSYMVMMTQILVFITGPLMYAYFYLKPYKCFPKSFPIHFIPVVMISLLIILRLSNAGFLSFLTQSMSLGLSVGDGIVMIMALISNVTYLLFSWRIVLLKTTENIAIDKSRLFLVSGLVIISLCNLSAVIYLILLALNITTIATYFFDMFFLLLTSIIIMESGFILKYPEAFKKETTQLVVENVTEIKHRLEALMKDKKPFKDPNLNIAVLSAMIEVKPHILSKVLNENFNLNFRDFVNNYRIREFIAMGKSDDFDNYTFLALAHEAGFNSKSTFNNAFKKVTNQTPRDFFKHESISKKNISSNKSQQTDNQ